MDTDTLHIVPVNDLIEHDSSGDEACICGPKVEAVPRDDGSMGWMVVHHSLDGREHHESPPYRDEDAWQDDCR